jgi:hypothetical protein
VAIVTVFVLALIDVHRAVLPCPVLHVAAARVGVVGGIAAGGAVVTRFCSAGVFPAAARKANHGIRRALLLRSLYSHSLGSMANGADLELPTILVQMASPQPPLLSSHSSMSRSQ